MKGLKVSDFDKSMITAIANRARVEFAKEDKEISMFYITLLLQNIHSTEYPLALEKLLTSPREDFLYDIEGMMSAYDVDAEKLLVPFVPKCVKEIKL